nr:metalloenzyme domain protein [Deinobacterium chartae]
MGSVWEQPLPTLEALLARGLRLDARLGVAGLPQSGTGQTAWLSGVNAAAHMGRHYGPWPGPSLKPLLEESTPVRLARAGGRVALLNDYPEGYFRPGRRHGCVPYSALAAGLELNPAGLPSVSPLLGLDYQAPWAPLAHEDDLRRQGERVARATRELDLALIDLWLSDHLGHLGQTSVPQAVLQAGRAYLRRLEAFVSGLLEGGGELVLSSDHGNLEDLSTGSHTYANVPLLASHLELPPLTDIARAGAYLQARLLGAPLPVEGGTVSE